MAGTEGRISLTRDGAVVTLSLDRPGKRNALTLPMLEGLREELVRLRDDRTARVLILRGAGEGVFCAGADLGVFGGLDPASARGFARSGQEVTLLLESLPLPVLAAVDGPCVGGGLELALGCDLILASVRAVFRAPEVAHGFPPGWGCTVRLPRRVGLGRAKDIILTSRAVGAAEALAIGLVEAVFPADGFEAGVAGVAADLAAKAPLALALAKEAVLAGAEASLEAGLALERESFALAFTTADAKEGVRAFLEKRPPRFTGR